MIMPMFPELNSCPDLPESGWKSRYIEPSWLMSVSVVRARTPSAELKAAFVLSLFRISPPAAQSMASYSHTVVSLPSTGNTRPNTLFAGSVIALAAARRSSQVQSPVGSGMPAFANRSLL